MVAGSGVAVMEPDMGAQIISSFFKKSARRLASILGLRASSVAASALASAENAANQDDLRFARRINELDPQLAADVLALHRRERLRRDLIADISHDLRGPLALISGSAERALDSLDENSEPSLRQHCLSIIKTGGLLQRLLAEMLELTRLEAAETAAQTEPVSVAQLLSDLAIAFQTEAGRRGISLVEETGGKLPQVAADMGLMIRALTNLLENALKHTPKGGIVTLRARPHSDGVLIEIADTGEGMSAEDLEWIFERFKQAPNHKEFDPQRLRKSSAGLGLAIVKKIVELHGSRIDVISERDRGTAFSFVLPPHRAAGSE